MLRNIRPLFLIGIIVLLLYSQLSLASNNEDECLKTYINDILSKDVVKRYNAVIHIHNHGKNAIPILIEKIDTDKMAWIAVKHPYNSNFLKEAMTNYAGVLYAYVIELILGRENLVPNKYPITWILGDSMDNYVYWYGVINCKGKRKSFDLDDMKAIKRIYQEWWDKNKSRPIEELRTDWENGIKPLTGSDYKWG